MTALLFALGIVALCIALIVVLVRHRKHKQDNNNIGVCIPNNRRIIDIYDITVMKLHDDLLDERLDKYGIKKVSKKYKEDDNDSDWT